MCETANTGENALSTVLCVDLPSVLYMYIMQHCNLCIAIASLFQNGADYVKKIKGVFCFKVKKGSDTGVWVVDVKNGNGSVKFDPKGG